MTGPEFRDLGSLIMRVTATVLRLQVLLRAMPRGGFDVRLTSVTCPKGLSLSVHSLFIEPDGCGLNIALKVCDLVEQASVLYA